MDDLIERLRGYAEAEDLHVDERATLLEAAAALEAAGWQPIETAPKDETRVLAFSPLYGVMSSHWQGGLWQGFPWRAGLSLNAAQPTHWMPLPAPPKEARNG